MSSDVRALPDTKDHSILLNTVNSLSLGADPDVSTA